MTFWSQLQIVLILKVAMKNIICIFSFAFLIQCICCNQELLSKFHQNQFKAKDVRLQLFDFDKDIYHFFDIKIFKYNRTTTAHNITLSVKMDTKDNSEILIQAYKFLSNEYRHFPVRFQVNLKKAVDANVVGLRNVNKCGNISSFYFYKDTTYHACNFVMDDKHLPPLIPSGRYKIDITILLFNKEVAWMSLFGEIYTPIEYPKNLETLTSPESVIRTGLPQVISAMVKNLLLISTTNLSPYLILEGAEDSNSNSTHHFNTTSVAWFGYLNMAIVPIGGVVSGFVTNAIGTKFSLQGALAILIFLRLISLFFKESWNFYLVVILTNFCSEFFKGPVFTHLAESAEPHLRTTLSASASSSMIFGQFQQLLMSTFLSRKVTTYINCALPGICIFLLIIVPETPHALMVKNKFEEARKSLAWYRGWVKIELVEPEYQKLLAYHKEEELKRKAEEEEEEQKQKQESTLNSITSKSSCLNILKGTVEGKSGRLAVLKNITKKEKNENKESGVTDVSNNDKEEPETSSTLNSIKSKSSRLNIFKGTIEGESSRLAVLKNVTKKENKEPSVTEVLNNDVEEPSTSSTLKSITNKTSRLNILKESAEGSSGRLAGLKNITTSSGPLSVFKNVTTGATNQLGSIKGAVTSESSLLGTVKDKVPIHLLEEGFSTVKNVKIFTRQSFVLPLALVTFTHFLVYFTGTTVLLSQPEKILNSLESPLNARYAAVVLSGANVVGSFISVMVIKICGKRLIVFISLIGMTVCSVAVSLYAYVTNVYHENNHNVTESIPLATTPSWNAYNWIPLVILFLLCIISNFGLCNLPWVLVGELFSKSTRAVGTGIVSGITSLLDSFCNSSLGTLLNILGFSGLYGFYAGVSVAGVIILRFVLPDTEGKSLEEIEKHFDELPFYNNTIISRYFNVFVSKFRKVNITCLESSATEQEKEELNSEKSKKNRC